MPLCRVFRLCQMAFALIFTLARILAGPPLTYYTVINKDSHPLVKVRGPHRDRRTYIQLYTQDMYYDLSPVSAPLQKAYRLASFTPQVGAVGILVVSLLWFHKIVSMVTRTKKPKADGPSGDAPQVERRATRSSSKRSEKEA